MIQFVCDSCLAVRAPNETWILGLAAEAVGVTAARREVTILPVWDRDRAVHPLAVHFCSEKCKEHYITELFGEEAEAQEEEVERIVTRVSPRTRRGRVRTESRKSRGRNRAA